MPQNKPLLNENERLLRLPDVLSRVPVSKSSWYHGIQAGIYPRPIKIGTRMSAWRESDILSLLQNGVAGE